MVEFKDVSVTYSSGVDALNKVNLKINDGDFAFVVGPSGAGKSTLIKLVLKEIDATSGTVMVNGFNLKKLRRRKIPALRRTIGVVFQDFRLIPTMTVYENVAFVLRVIDAPAKYIRSRVPYVISLVGLSDKAKSYPTELSGGEQQRVALARALVNDPQLIIADEPTGNIDPALSYEETCSSSPSATAAWRRSGRTEPPFLWLPTSMTLCAISEAELSTSTKVRSPLTK